MSSALTSASALVWGFQFAFLSPVLALLLVTLYGATPSEVGWVLTIYHASGFVATILIPGWADRHRNYLRPMLFCALLTVGTGGILFLATTLPAAVTALVVLGAPGSVGSTLLFAEIRHSGAGVSVLMRTRAMVSVAWVAGPPLATLIMGVAGNRSILPVLAGLGLLNVVGTLAMASERRRSTDDGFIRKSAEPRKLSVRMAVLVAVIVAFTLLQATNSAVTSIVTIYVTENLGLGLLWGGSVLGVAAFLEVPAFWLIGRLALRFSSRALMLSGCLAGIVFYVGLVFARDPVALLVLQIPNAWFYAVVAGVGLTMFQDMIPRPGLATGLNGNAGRVGAIISGPIIAISAIDAVGYSGIFVVCAVLTAIALGILLVAHPPSKR